LNTAIEANFGLTKHADDLFRGIAFAAHSFLLFKGQNAPNPINRPGPLLGGQVTPENVEDWKKGVITLVW